MDFINQSIGRYINNMILVKNLIINQYAELENEIGKRVTQLLIKNTNLPIKKIIKTIHKDIEKVFLINKEQIEQVLKSMIKEKKVLITEEQPKDDFLNMIDRKTIFYCIQENPGKTIEELCMSLKLTRNQMIWHLAFLEKIFYIRAEKRKNSAFYYPTNNHLLGGN